MIVAVSIVLYILCALYKPLAPIAVTYGYACTFAYLTQNQAVFKPNVMLSPNMKNALLIVPLSLIIGACFAFASAKLANWIQRANHT